MAGQRGGCSHHRRRRTASLPTRRRLRRHAWASLRAQWCSSPRQAQALLCLRPQLSVRAPLPPLFDRSWPRGRPPQRRSQAGRPGQLASSRAPRRSAPGSARGQASRRQEARAPRCRTAGRLAAWPPAPRPASLPPCRQLPAPRHMSRPPTSYLTGNEAWSGRAPARRALARCRRSLAGSHRARLPTEGPRWCQSWLHARRSGLQRQSRYPSRRRLFQMGGSPAVRAIRGSRCR